MPWGRSKRRKSCRPAPFGQRLCRMSAQQPSSLLPCPLPPCPLPPATRPCPMHGSLLQPTLYPFFPQTDCPLALPPANFSLLCPPRPRQLMTNKHLACRTRTARNRKTVESKSGASTRAVRVSYSSPHAQHSQVRPRSTSPRRKAPSSGQRRGAASRSPSSRSPKRSRSPKKKSVSARCCGSLLVCAPAPMLHATEGTEGMPQKAATSSLQLPNVCVLW